LSAGRQLLPSIPVSSIKQANCLNIAIAIENTTDVIIESDLYLEVTSGAKKKWSFKTGEYLNEVQFR
jgi:hypothetical protein